jgi:hypothetical protein
VAAPPRRCVGLRGLYAPATSSNSGEFSYSVIVPDSAEFATSAAMRARPRADLCPVTAGMLRLLQRLAVADNGLVR